jgi:uncharacterized protein with von Willebrand factor type A (vWA) domain
VELLPNLLVFGRILRQAGVSVPANWMADAAAALPLIDIGRRTDVFHTLRALLIRRREDLAVFERAFNEFWRARGEAWGRTDVKSIGEKGSGLLSLSACGAAGIAGSAAQDAAADRPPWPVLTWSAHEALRRKNFAQFTAEEIEEARRAMAALAWDIGERRSRRWQPSRVGRAVDMRRVLRLNLKTGGELVHLPRRERSVRPRGLVVLCDVSGSMERYSRMLLHFVHALTAGRARVEAFLFATRLTRITHQLRQDRVDAAVSAVGDAVRDWGGGTRIGEAIRQFHVHWGRRVLGRGASVLLISDGWDRGDPSLLRREIQRLQRSSHRLIWLNPLLGSADYAPLTRGLQAALPFVDDFLPAHNLASLEALTAHLNSLPPRRPARRHGVA